MPKKWIRVGLIGCGANMRDTHVPRLAADGGVDVVAVADPARQAADELTAAWGAATRYYRDWRAMLAGEDLDAVLISTPHDVHFDQVRRALESGAHVLVEKPLTISPRHSKRLLALAEEAGRVLAVAYQRHHMAPFRYARELVRRGRLGEIGGVVGYVTQGSAARAGWRLSPEAAGGGMFADTGSHLVAAALWISGLTPRWVNAAVDRAGDPVDVNVSVQVGFAGGALGSLSTFGNAGRHDERLAFSGSKGSLVIHLHEWRFRSMLLNDEPVPIPKRVAESTPDAAFLGWVRNGRRGYEPPAYAHRTVQLTAAAYRSAERGTALRLRS